MTNQELDVLMQIVLLVRDSEKLQQMSYENLSRWVSRQLHLSLGLTTAPQGASWLVNSSKSLYDYEQEQLSNSLK